MFLLTLGTPFGLALAGSLKVFPALAAVYWLGRRDWPMLGRFVAWGLGLAALSFVLEPSGTIAFLTFPKFELVGEVTNLSPYAISPVLWAIIGRRACRGGRRCSRGRASVGSWRCCCRCSRRRACTCTNSHRCSPSVGFRRVRATTRLPATWHLPTA